jgi:hypothetical protein
VITAPTTDAAAVEPRMRLGEISQRLGFDVTANFLASLGFAPAATEKAAKLYHAKDFPLICNALVRHVRAVQSTQVEQAALAALAEQSRAA